MFPLQFCRQSFYMSGSNYCHNPFALSQFYFFCHKLISFINQNPFHFRRLFCQHLHCFRKCIAFLEFFYFFLADFFTYKQTGKKLTQDFHSAPKCHPSPGTLQGYFNIPVCQNQFRSNPFCSICCFKHFCTRFYSQLRTQAFLEGSHDQICKKQKGFTFTNDLINVHVFPLIFIQHRLMSGRTEFNTNCVRLFLINDRVHLIHT